MALQLLGSVLSIYPLETPNLDQCIYIVVNFAAHPTESQIALASLSLESLTDFVAAPHFNYRTNESSLRIFSTVMESVFGIVARLTQNIQMMQNSFLSWDAPGEYIPRLVHFCRTFMTNHFNYFRYGLITH